MGGPMSLQSGELVKRCRPIGFKIRFNIQKFHDVCDILPVYFLSLGNYSHVFLYAPV